VDAKGKGHCPHCGCFLPQNIAAQTHGLRRRDVPKESEDRRDELFAAMLADLGSGVSPIEAVIAKDWAVNCAQLEQIDAHLLKVGLFTQQGAQRNALNARARISERVEKLSAILGDFKAQRKAASQPPLTGADRMSVSALERTHALLSRLRRGDTLTEREQGQLDILRAAMYGELELPSELTADGAPLRGTTEI
jgi:hypothetical protein